MKIYSVTYDLMKPGQNYSDLWDRLRTLGALKIEESHWLVKHAGDAMEIVKDLLRYIDGNDRLFVAHLSGEAAWRNLIVTNERVQQFFAA